MQRRKFLFSSCQACVAAAAGLSLADLAGCTAAAKVVKAPLVGGLVQVPLASLGANGSVQRVRPEGWPYDIAVSRSGASDYQALLLSCTHQRNPLTTTPGGFLCTLHGSQFDQNGNVRKGPAAIPLKHYETTVDNGNLIIHVN